jgi:hypothetical protein
MQQIKKRGLGQITNIAVQGMFGYSAGGPDACGLAFDTPIYRNSVNGNFAEATILATDIDLTMLAPAGYYSEYDLDADAVISRNWSGTAFVGAPDICF